MTTHQKLGLLLAAAGMALSLAASAAVPKDWWVDIANNRVDDIKSMLAQGTDPNAISRKGQPAIMEAIRDSAWDVYDALAADTRTKIDAVNIHNETPLMYLAVVGQTRRAETLIARGAHVNRLGWTPLQYAASKGHLDTVKMLIAHKAIIDAPAPDGTTALMMAAFSGSQPVVQFLLDSGAEATAQNLGHHDAADWARLGKHDALAAKLQALIQKTLAARAAQHARDVAAQAAGAGAAQGTTPGQPAAPGAQAPGGQSSPAAAAQGGAVSGAAAASQAPPAASGQHGDSGGSTAKYFSPEDNANPQAGN